ncbi:MAG: hypothetical protein R3F55_21365 [Alphaproteobacteria bacterium]
MRHVNDGAGRDHVEIEPTEARQGEPGRPMMYVLLGGIGGTVFGFAIALLAFAG